MSTHLAVVSTAVRGPLEVIQVPTVAPTEGEVRVRVEWTGSTPFDLHQTDGGLLAKHPQVLGDSLAGIVVEIGPGVKRLELGDKVFGFAWREQKERAYQEFATLPETLLGKVPAGFTSQQAVTLPVNFVTVFHAVTTDLGLALPWPRPSAPHPRPSDDPILVWGGASSVGQYALQILAHYGYRNLLATASAAHHPYLRSLGAVHVVDYKDPDVATLLLEAANKSSVKTEPAIPFILDCIGSKDGSIASIAKLAQKGAKVAVLLPIIVRDATETVAPEYAMDVQVSADWAEGVEARGVRTHFYLENEFFRDNLQPIIMPTLLAEGVVKPNRQRIIEGPTLLARAQKAIDTLRRKEVSGEKLVLRVCEDESKTE